MCGIVGKVSKKIDLIKFKDTIKITSHRGPDNQGFFKSINKASNLKIAFGHNRLSIIDMSYSSNQPFIDGDQVIIFNGEIYNYKLLKNKLIKKGILFKTKGDTEVILKLYQYYGLQKTLKMLEGMFAIVIYDQKINRVFIARDSFGIKPLVYYYNNNDLFFASELKSILKYYGHKNFSVCPDATASVYYHRYVLEPKTIFKEIKILESGHFIEYDLMKQSLNTFRYWKPKISEDEINEEEAIDQVDKILFESVKKHLESDVPVSIAYSGGLDSSIILAMAKKIKPNIKVFTVNRGSKDIDVKYAIQIADYLKVSLELIKFDNNLNDKDINYLHEIYDQPIACSSIFSTFMLYKQISAKGYKVVLTGDGADELFGGYEWYTKFLGSNYNLKNLIFNAKYILKYNLLLKSKNDFERYKKVMLDRFNHEEIRQNLGLKSNYTSFNLYRNISSKYGIKSLSSIKDLMLLDFNSFMKYNLLRTDFSSMAHSVEARVPFLDKSLVEYSLKMPSKLIYKNSIKKYLLKKVAERYLPKEMIYRPKKGFSSPVTKILPVKNGKQFQDYVIQQWKLNHFE